MGNANIEYAKAVAADPASFYKERVPAEQDPKAEQRHAAFVAGHPFPEAVLHGDDSEGGTP